MKAYWLEGRNDVTTDDLAAEGIYYAALSNLEAEYQPPLDDLKANRGYIQQDIVELSPSTPNLDAICTKFEGEHSHDDDEVRFVLDGEGIFDIRTRDDRYVRVVVERGDLIIVPKDRHHRFLLTDTKTIRCVRLFRDMSGWVPHYRTS